MKRSRIFIMVMTGMLISASVWAETKTIKGEIIDVSCYAAEGAKGAEHKACAAACLKAGEPAGILEEGTDKVYVVVTGDHNTNPSAKMIPYVAKTVEVTGDVNDKRGVTTIDVKTIKEIADTSMPTPDRMKEKRSVSGY